MDMKIGFQEYMLNNKDYFLYNGKDLNSILVSELSEEVKVKLKVNKI